MSLSLSLSFLLRGNSWLTINGEKTNIKVPLFQLVYDEMLDRIQRKEEKEAKKKKRLGDKFFDLLQSIRVRLNHCWLCPLDR